MGNRCLFFKFAVLILVAAAWGQQFNSSPNHSLTQQQLASSQDIRTGENQKQKFQFLTIPIEQTQLSSREVKPVSSTQTFQHSRQNNAVVQERFQQSVQSKSRDGIVTPITQRNVVNAPTSAITVHQSTAEPHSVHQTQNFQQVPSQGQAFQSSTQTHQTFQTTSFPTSQQGFQPSTSFSAQQKISNPILKTESPEAQAQQQHFTPAQQQTVQTTNRRTVQIKSTSVQQTVHRAQPIQNNALNSHVQQPTGPHHQQQTTLGNARTQPSVVQTFQTQQFSTQNQPLPQQQHPGKETSSQSLRPQHQKVHKIKATHSQQQEEPQKKFVHNQQTVEETTLSPEEELFQKQAKNAKYSFDSAVTDNIMDNTQIRQEKRDGLNVSGLYSYSDGFYKRTVHYKADEGGYRVIKEVIEPIGSGPQVNPDGDAAVNTNIAGVNNMYSITAADIQSVRESEEDTEP